jgi:hypothetical protein
VTHPPVAVVSLVFCQVISVASPGKL